MRQFNILLLIFSFSFQLSAQVVKPDIEFKNFKQVDNELNIYFDIINIIDTSQVSTISNAIEQNTEIISCRIYLSSYGTYRCGAISTLFVDAVAIREVLLEQNIDYDMKTVRVNKKEILLNTQNK